MDKKYELIFCIINAGFADTVKEIVMLLVPKEIKDDVLRYIYDFAGLNTEGQGIAFSMPVEKAVGLKDFGKAQEVQAESKEN